MIILIILAKTCDIFDIILKTNKKIWGELTVIDRFYRNIWWWKLSGHHVVVPQDHPIIFLGEVIPRGITSSDGWWGRWSARSNGADVRGLISPPNPTPPPISLEGFFLFLFLGSLLRERVTNFRKLYTGIPFFFFFKGTKDNDSFGGWVDKILRDQKWE